MAPRISAIVPAFNNASHIDKAIASLLNTGYGDLEIVIVDDGSRDNTLEVANAWRCRESTRVNVLHHKHHANRGVSETRNVGIQQSSGELICFLDADDYVLPHRFETCVKLLSDDPDIDGVYEATRIEFTTEQDELDWREESRFFGLHRQIPSNELLPQLLRGVTWHTSGITVRKTLLNSTGLFEPSLSTAEDCNLWFRMTAVGRIEAGCLDEPVSVYVRRPNSLFGKSWRSRRNMLDAMSAFERWMTAKRLPLAQQQLVRAAIAEYALNSITQVRSSGGSAESRTMALHAIKKFPRLVEHSLFWKHAAHIILAHLRPDPLSARGR